MRSIPRGVPDTTLCGLYFIYIISVSLIGGGCRSTKRKLTIRLQVADKLYHIKLYQSNLVTIKNRSRARYSDKYKGLQKPMHGRKGEGVHRSACYNCRGFRPHKVL